MYVYTALKFILGGGSVVVGEALYGPLHVQRQGQIAMAALLILLATLCLQGEQ